MLLGDSTGEQEEVENYMVRYFVTQYRKEKSNITEYGIRCILYEAGRITDISEVNAITTEQSRIEEFLQIIKRNQVFPVHLKDVIEDLLISEFEEENKIIFT